MYLIEKIAIYSHGVFWIGEDLGEGHKKLKELALSDEDCHHEWLLCEYTENEGGRLEGTHKEIKSIRKSDVCPHQRVKMIPKGSNSRIMSVTICEDCKARV